MTPETVAGKPEDAISPRIEPASDRSILVTFGDRIAPAVGARVRRCFRGLAAARLDGVTNLHPAYVSLLVEFDPLRIGFQRLIDAVARVAATLAGQEDERTRVVGIPVCYGDALGPDLASVAAHCGLAADDVIARHAAGRYLVHFLGFSPGFPYLGGLDPALATPRLDTPRTRVPAGSVAIGGTQTGIYPSASPGGWRIIGRTPLRLFDPTRTPPALVEMGDELCFRPISHDEFERLAGSV